MKTFTITALALAAVAAANPLSPPLKCTPGTYRCDLNSQTQAPGWAICDVSQKWVVSNRSYHGNIYTNLCANFLVIVWRRLPSQDGLPLQQRQQQPVLRSSRLPLLNPSLEDYIQIPFQEIRRLSFMN